jgi:type II secretory pathway component HofQ
MGSTSVYFRRKSMLGRGLILTFLLVTTALYGTQMQGRAAEQTPKQKPARVTNMFFDTPLRQALSDISAQTGIMIVPGAEVRAIVTCEFKDVPLDRALRMLLAGTPYEVQKDDGFYLVYDPSAEGQSFQKVSTTRRVTLNYIDGATAMKLLDPRLKGYVQGSPEENLLCVTAPPPVMERVMTVLDELDRPRQHVLLNARVVVLEQTDMLDMGLRYDFPTARIGTFSNSDHHGSGALSPGWPWAAEVGLTPGKQFTDALMIALNLMVQNEEARIVASPQLMAQDGEKAEIKVTTDEYFEISNGNGSEYFDDVDLEVIKSGTILQILPRVTEDGEVKLRMSGEVSDVVARGENNLPVVNTRTAKNVVRVKDGGTAAVAGLLDVSDEISYQRVPFLGRLPLIGKLFTNREHMKVDRQVAVFVTARVAPVGEDLSGGAAPSESMDEIPEKVFRRKILEVLDG